MTGSVASLFQANGVEWVKGYRPLQEREHDRGRGGEDVTFKQAIIATGSFPLRPPIEGLDSPRCIDSTLALAKRGAAATRRVGRRDHRRRVRVDLPALRQRSDDHRDAAAPLHPARGRGRVEGAREAVQRRNIAMHLEKQCTKVEDDGSQLTVTPATAKPSRPT